MFSYSQLISCDTLRPTFVEVISLLESLRQAQGDTTSPKVNVSEFDAMTTSGPFLSLLDEGRDPLANDGSQTPERATRSPIAEHAQRLNQQLGDHHLGDVKNGAKRSPAAVASSGEPAASTAAGAVGGASESVIPSGIFLGSPAGEGSSYYET